MSGANTLEVGDQNNNTDQCLLETKCCIPNCDSCGEEISFFAFPDKNTDLLAHRCWLREVRMQASNLGKSFQLEDGALVCELHFRSEDVTIADTTGGTKFLKEGSIPVVYNKNTVQEMGTTGGQEDAEEDKSSNDEKEDEEIEFLKEVKPMHNRNLNVRGKEKTLEDLEMELKEKEQQLKQRHIKEKKQQQELTNKQRLLLEKEQQESKLKDLLEQQQNYKKMSNQEKDVEQRKAKELQKGLTTKVIVQRKSKWQQQKESLQEMLRQEQEKLSKIHQQETMRKPEKQRNLKESVRNSPRREDYSIEESPCKKCLKLKCELTTLKEKLKRTESDNTILQLELQNNRK